MRWITWLALVFVLIPGLAYTPKPETFDKDKAIAYAIAGRIYDRSAYRAEVTLKEHVSAISTIWKRGRELGLTDEQRKVFAAMVYVESGYKHDARQGDSYGPAQVRDKYKREFEKHIKNPEYYALPDRHPVKSIWVGLAAFRQKLAEAREYGGKTWAAVRFYNGRGKRGFLYLQKVRAAHASFFN